MTTKQTHIRISLNDKKKLDQFMKFNRIKSQVKALRIIFRRAKI